MARNLLRTEQLKIDHKNSCRVATTGNIAIATDLNSGDSIDGVTLADGDRVLVKDQITGSEKGIYIVDATPFRALDLDGDAFVTQGTNVKVSEGTVNAQTAWILITADPITVGVTAQDWQLFISSAASGTGGGFRHAMMLGGM